MNGAKAPETPSPVLQEKTVTPETLPTVVGADEGYDGLSQVTVNPDTNLKAENIRSGKTIFGVGGTFEGASTSSQLLNAIYANMRRDGNYVETLTTSAFPEDLGVPDIADYSTIYFLTLGASVKTLYIDTSIPGATITLNGGALSSGRFPTKVICTKTTSSYAESSILSGCIIGFPEVPSGGNDKFMGSRVQANIVVDGDMIIDDTHWFNNSTYKGYWLSEFGYLNTDGVYRPSINVTLIHFKRNVSALYTYVLYFQSPYSVRFYSETPPTLTGDPFSSNLRQIIVPKGLLETYQNASGWSKYTSKMVEADE